MYRIHVKYRKDGLVAFTGKAENLTVAHAKAAHFRSQGFHVEIIGPDGKPAQLNEV